jgi:hypothetical protein
MKVIPKASFWKRLRVMFVWCAKRLYWYIYIRPVEEEVRKLEKEKEKK